MTLPRLVKEAEASDSTWRVFIRDAINGLIKRTSGSGPTSSRPANPLLPMQYFDTTLGKPVWWNGTGWVDATGTTV